MQTPALVIQRLDIKHSKWVFAISGWCLFLIYSVTYCSLYSGYVDTTQPGTLIWSLQWTLTEYGYWIPATPFLLGGFNSCEKSAMRYAVALALAAALVMTCLRVGVDFYLNPHATMPNNIIYFAPTHITVAVVVFLVWFGLLRTPTTSNNQPTFNTEQVDTKHHDQPQALDADKIIEVQKGNISKQLSITSIDSINAAGNYMEVVAGNEVYLTRSTLSELEKQLPPDRFIRIHRSYLVNVYSIVNVIPKGNLYQVTLKNAQSLPLSKQRKSALEGHLLKLR